MKALGDIEALSRATLDREDPDDDYPPCWRCDSFMESGEGEPTKFCAECIYEVADEHARALLAVLPVLRAAEAWQAWADRVQLLLGNCPADVAVDLYNALDEMRQQLGGE